MKADSGVEGPIRSFLYPHEAIRREAGRLEERCTELGEGDGIEEFGERLRLLRGFVRAHGEGEDEFLYPEVNRLRQGLGDSFGWDHRIDEEYFDRALGQVEALRDQWSPEEWERLVRNMAGLRAVLYAHSKKEDEIVVPLVDRHLAPPQQGEIVGRMTGHIPKEILEDVWKLIIDRNPQEGRKDFVGMVKQGAPPEEFEVLETWTRDALSEEEWLDMCSSIDGLGTS